MNIDIGIILGIAGLLLTLYFGLKTINKKITNTNSNNVNKNTNSNNINKNTNSNNVSNNTNSGNGNQYNIGGSADYSFKDKKKWI